MIINYSKVITILLFIINSLFRFIRNCGTHLTHLRLDSCAFVNDTTLIAISSFCKYLTGIVILIVKNTHKSIGVYIILELSLRSCTSINFEFTNPPPKFPEMERIDFYRTSISTICLDFFLIFMPKLKHINLGKFISFLFQ